MYTYMYILKSIKKSENANYYYILRASTAVSLVNMLSIITRNISGSLGLYVDFRKALYFLSVLP